MFCLCCYDEGRGSNRGPFRILSAAVLLSVEVGKMVAGGGFFGWAKGFLRNLTMVVFKFDHGQNIIQPWCFLNSTMVKFLNGGQIVPKKG